MPLCGVPALACPRESLSCDLAIERVRYFMTRFLDKHTHSR